MLEYILKRLDHVRRQIPAQRMKSGLTQNKIVYNDFPTPTIPPLLPQADSDFDGDIGASDLGEAAAHASAKTATLGPSETTSSMFDIIPASSAFSSSTTQVPTSPSVARSTPPPSIAPATSTPSVIANSQVTNSSGTPAGSAPAARTAQQNELPDPVLKFYRSIIRALRSEFTAAPPFTVQRLAELVRRPHQHYKTLPAYLRALDRAVTVSSPSSMFPLPPIASSAGEDTTASTYLAGSGGTQIEEDFDAAVLAPIPWLTEPLGPTSEMGQDREPPELRDPMPSVADEHTSPADSNDTSVNGGVATGGPPSQRTTDLHTARTEQIDGPRGAGSIETVTVGSRHAAFVGGGHFGSTSMATSGRGRAASQHLPTGTTNTAASLADEPALQDAADRADDQDARMGMDLIEEPLEESAGLHATHPPTTTVTSPPEEMPYARGPEEIGMADTGPQPVSRPISRARSPFDEVSSPGVVDAEIAIGRPGEAETVNSPSPGALARSPRPPAALKFEDKEHEDEDEGRMDEDGDGDESEERS